MQWNHQPAICLHHDRTCLYHALSDNTSTLLAFTPLAISTAYGLTTSGLQHHEV